MKRCLKEPIRLKSIILSMALVGIMVGLGTIKPNMAQGETRVLPSLSISEQYDSNVFFVPGANLEDFVTTTAPQVRVEHQSRSIEGNLRGGLTAQTYVKNPGLNYVAGSGGISLGLSQMVKKFTSRAGLDISNNFRFTPEVPAFLSSGTGNNVSEAFVTGLQAARANSFSNEGVGTGSYVLSPITTFKASYSHRFIRFGRPQASPALGGFFNTTFQNINAGPSVRVTARDTASLTYTYQHMGFSQGGGLGSDFENHGAQGGWTREIDPTLTLTLSGGFTVVAPQNRVQHLTNVSLDWKGKRSGAKLSYSRSIQPSFVITGLPLVTEAVAISTQYLLNQAMTLTAAGNYAENQSSSSSILKAKSLGSSVGINYVINRFMTASFLYSYSKFDQELLGNQVRFERQQVTFNIGMAWK